MFHQLLDYAFETIESALAKMYRKVLSVFN